MLIDDVVLLDLGPDSPRSAERAGAVLADVEHIVISHGHPDHLAPAALLWRSWLMTPSPLQLHGPTPALELVEPWLPPGESSVTGSPPVDAVALRPMTAGEVRELSTRSGTYTVRALAVNHDDPCQSDEPTAGRDVHRTSALAYLIEGPDHTRILYATDTAYLLADTIAALADTALDVVFLDETFGTHYTHNTGHHDLRTFEEQLIELRTCNAVTEATDVIAVHLSHHNPPDVAARLRRIGARVVSDRTVIDTQSAKRGPLHLLIGGARSGKSLIAENVARNHERTGQIVTYVATAAPQQHDVEWDARIAAHRERRPSTWRTVETLDLVSLLDSATAADTLLIDCLSLWVTGLLDASDAWTSDANLDIAVNRLRQQVALLIDALLRTPADVIVVSNEVGQGVVPATKSGRVFRDELGRLNAAVGNVATYADFVVAGRVLPLATALDHLPPLIGDIALATSPTQSHSGANS